MWRDRAEAAERRVQVFEKFTARLRGIREAAAQVDEAIITPAVKQEPESDTENGQDLKSDSSDAINPLRNVVIRRGRRVKVESGDSGDSGRTEDAGIVKARIKKCLHGEKNHNEDDSDGDGFGGDSAYSRRHRDRSTTTDMEILLAAKEMLEFEDVGSSL